MAGPHAHRSVQDASFIPARVVHQCVADVSGRLDVCIEAYDDVNNAPDTGTEPTCWINIRTACGEDGCLQGDVPMRDLDLLIAGLQACVAAGRAAGVLSPPRAKEPA